MDSVVSQVAEGFPAKHLIAWLIYSAISRHSVVRHSAEGFPAKLLMAWFIYLLCLPCLLICLLSRWGPFQLNIWIHALFNILHFSLQHLYRSTRPSHLFRSISSAASLQFRLSDNTSSLPRDLQQHSSQLFYYAHLSGLSVRSSGPSHLVGPVFLISPSWSLVWSWLYCLKRYYSKQVFLIFH